MAKPASRTSARSGGNSRKGNSIFTGMLIGLIVGAALAVGVALWATGSIPFKSAVPQRTQAKPAPVKPSVHATPAAPEPAPNFDFYKVLPGDAPSELPAAPPAASHPPLYYLQAGAFQNPAVADNLKAQLAMLAVEAAIQTSEQGGKGVFHRVRVGPFRTVDEADRTRAVLKQNNIPVTLVKEPPTTQETP